MNAPRPVAFETVFAAAPCRVRPAQQATVYELFDRMLELSWEEREVEIPRACASNQDLEERLRRLLSIDDALSPSFLDALPI